MTTKPKMKGIFKGFKYISQIFDEEKEDEIKIGFPTDVKHVAHIGWDGPTAVDNPSWMKEFGSSTQSAPLGPPTKGEPEIKWVSEDSSTRRNNKAAEEVTNPGKDDVPKTSRRHNSAESESPSPRKKEPSTKPRRRNHSSEGSVRSTRHLQDSSDSPSPNIPSDPAKKSRRKKSRDLGGGGGGGGGGGSTRSRPKPTNSPENRPDITKNQEKE